MKDEKPLGADAAAVGSAGSIDRKSATARHTKGPWRVVSDFVGPFRVVNKKDNTIAAVGYANSSEAMANAELMAAAPEMKEAIVNLLARIDDIAFVRREGITGAAYSVITAFNAVDITDEFNALEAAIAKAEGRS